MPRLHCPLALVPGQLVALPAAAARHLQVLRLQPGDGVTLFGAIEAAPCAGTEDLQQDCEFDACVHSMDRSKVHVLVGPRHLVSREASVGVHLAVGLPAAERMDWLVEKATELGALSIQPLIAQRTQLRLDDERSLKKTRHWQAVAVAACEQCGRNRVPLVHPVMPFAAWLAAVPREPGAGRRWLLDPGAAEDSLVQARRSLLGQSPASVLALSGPEGGLTEQERAGACAAGFSAVALGPRMLRAETAPLALLAALTLGR